VSPITWSLRWSPFALAQLVFVFEPGVEPLQVRSVPERIRLFLDGDASRDALAHQESVADLLEDLLAST